MSGIVPYMDPIGMKFTSWQPNHGPSCEIMRWWCWEPRILESKGKPRKSSRCFMDLFVRCFFFYRIAPSLKLTVHPWEWMVGILSFPFGARPIFRGELLNFGGVCCTFSRHQTSKSLLSRTPRCLGILGYTGGGEWPKVSGWNLPRWMRII